MLKFAKLVVTCLVTVLTITASARGDSNPRKLKVAAVLGLTGGAAYHSQGIRRGLEVAEEELRKNGWTVDIRFEDDQTQPAKTASAFRFLLSQGYQLFVGPTWSFQANAIKGILPASGAVAMVPAGSSEINGGAVEGMFNLCPSRSKQTPYIESWLKGAKFKRGFIATTSGDWGDVHRKVFRKAMENSGGAIVGEEEFSYGADTTSLKTLLQKAMHAGADIVFTTGGTAEVANVVNAREEAQLKFAILATNDVRDALNLGLIRNEHSLQNVFAVGLTIQDGFSKKYAQRYGEKPSLYADRAYDGLMLLAHATEKTDGSASQIRRFLTTDSRLPGLSGHIRFDKDGDVESGSYQIVEAKEK